MTALRGMVWPIALVGWTLLVRIIRIRNLLAEDSLGTGQRIDFAISSLFLGLAVAVLIAISWRRWRRWTIVLSGALAVSSIAWWSLRGVQILVGEWEAGFKVVHSVLALITIGIGWMVIRWSRVPSESLWVSQ